MSSRLGELVILVESHASINNTNVLTMYASHQNSPVFVVVDPLEYSFYNFTHMYAACAYYAISHRSLDKVRKGCVR